MTYEAGKRFSGTVKLTATRHWEQTYGWQTTEITLFKLEDQEGNLLVWKTSGYLGIDKEDEKGNWIYDAARIGDEIEIKATVKAFGEYKGEQQIEIQRVKVQRFVSRAKTKEQKEQEHKEEQLASLKDGDQIWDQMPYKQYKEHYSDCETVAGSFIRMPDGNSYISVIIRAGRLKASGVRGERYSGYQLQDRDGRKVVYRAVKEENAIRRAVKEYGDLGWECTKIFEYNNR